MNCSFLRRSPTRICDRHAKPGFTLVELLVVLGIVVILLALVVPAVRSLNSNNLSNSGRLFSNLLTVARSEAINRGTLMQVRIVTDAWATGGKDDTTTHYRKFSLWQHKAPPTAGAASDPDPYAQVSAWETLPDGIIFEANPTPGTDAYYPFSSTTPGPGTYFLDPSLAAYVNKSAVAAGGGATMNAVCIEFTPTGALNLAGAGAVSTLYFLLVPGVLSGSGTTVTYTTVHHPNWLMVQITPLTGRIQILRP